MRTTPFARLWRRLRRRDAGRGRAPWPDLVPYEQPAHTGARTEGPGGGAPATVLGFRDGSAVTLDPDSPAATGLQTLALRLRQPGA